MSAYLDASVLLPTIVREASSPDVDGFLSSPGTELLVSDYAAAEVASGVSRHVRMHGMAAEHGRASLEDFDAWCIASVQRVEIDPRDVRLAEAYVRRFELKLRAPDALHLAVCRRLAATLVTRDRSLAAAAEALGLPVISISGE